MMISVYCSCSPQHEKKSNPEVSLLKRVFHISAVWSSTCSILQHAHNILIHIEISFSYKTMKMKRILIDQIPHLVDPNSTDMKRLTREKGDSNNFISNPIMITKSSWIKKKWSKIICTKQSSVYLRLGIFWKGGIALDIVEYRRGDWITHTPS